MTLIKWNNDFLPTFSNVIDDFFNGDWPAHRGVDYVRSVARVNVLDEDDKFIVEVAAPGMKKEDFSVNYMLFIKIYISYAVLKLLLYNFIQLCYMQG